MQLICYGDQNQRYQNLAKKCIIQLQAAKFTFSEVGITESDD